MLYRSCAAPNSIVACAAISPRSRATRALAWETSRLDDRITNTATVINDTVKSSTLTIVAPRVVRRWPRDGLGKFQFGVFMQKLVEGGSGLCKDFVGTRNRFQKGAGTAAHA